MGSQTQNLGLYKPDRTDYVSVITDINNNMDILDDAASMHDDGSAITGVFIAQNISLSDIHAYRLGRFVFLSFNVNFTGTSINTTIGLNFSDSSYEPLSDTPNWGIYNINTDGISIHLRNEMPFHSETSVAFNFIGSDLSSGDHSIPLNFVYICKGDSGD